jgi:hypothetical protein
MTTSFAPVSLNPAPSTTLWGIVLLEHLDEFATLAWYLVACRRENVSRARAPDGQSL